MNTEEHEKTVASAEKAVSANPADFELHVELGMAYFHAHRLDEAQAAFETALDLNPGAAVAHNGIGRVHYHTGPPQAAVEAYRRAMALDHHYVPAYYGLGILYSAQLGKYEDAVEAFQLGLAHNPHDALLHAGLGNTYARMGRFDEAIAMLQQAIDLDPELTYAYGNLSVIYLHQHTFDEMIASCRREIDIADSHDARRLLGFAYDRLGRPDKAIKELERSIALEPEDYEARAALAKVYRAVGRRKEADEHYALACEMAEQEEEYGHACVEAVSGNFNRALTLLAIALEKNQLQPGWARIDPEFFFMSDDPRFQALIENGR